MKKAILAGLKTVLLVIIHFMVSVILGAVLPMSYDVVGTLSPEEQGLFMPLYLLNVLINMSVLFVVLKSLRYKGWKLVFAVTSLFFGLFTVLNAIELLWYDKAFPMLTTLDVVKMLITSVVSYGVTALMGTLLVKGFKKEEQAKDNVFDAGRFYWKAGLFSVLYPPFYFCCGFITRLFPEAQEFYAGWAQTMESIPVLLLFNVFRGALWLLLSLPVLLGATTRKRAYWLMPLVLVTGTAISFLTPTPLIPPMVRVAHVIELTFSMATVGVFMVWLFLKKTSGLKDVRCGESFNSRGNI